MYIQTLSDTSLIYNSVEEQRERHKHLQTHKSFILDDSDLNVCSKCHKPYRYRTRSGFRCPDENCDALEKKFRLHIKNSFQVKGLRDEVQIVSIPGRPTRRYTITKIYTQFIANQSVARCALEVLLTGITGKEQRRFLRAKPEDLTFEAYHRAKCNFSSTLRDKCAAAINLAFVKHWLGTYNAIVQYRPDLYEFEVWLETLFWNQAPRSWILNVRTVYMSEELLELVNWSCSPHTCELIQSRF